ncbi:MAG: tyrosine-type recombinase/integrase [Marinilabiliaceae bacterium]|nr:tyrosine-type recombinase/integrase [Marinilabiliaceae bacterium]
MKLSDTSIRNAKPEGKDYRLSDGNTLYLLVKTAGGKYWRMDYRFQNKRKTLALGVYPRIKLKIARKRCHDARQLLDEGVDPGQRKKEAKQEASSANTLEFITREWHQKNIHTWTEGHARKNLGNLELNIFPWLGDKPIRLITALELLTALRRIEDRGALTMAHKAKQICGQVFRYAIATGRAEHDISASLKGALAPHKKRHMSAITDPIEVGGLLRAIDSYRGHFVTRCALKLAPMIFLRTIELRHAEWAEVSFDTHEWKIPAEKMKKRNMPHIIPLSKQAMEILQEIKPFTKHRSKYIFPSIRGNTRCMSENTILTALRRMGYSKEEMTGHGFRGMASTLLHENEWPPHVIELQLAHKENNGVKAAYNHALYMDKRREMMQWWADYLDKLKNTK